MHNDHASQHIIIELQNIVHYYFYIFELRIPIIILIITIREKNIRNVLNVDLMDDLGILMILAI